MFGHLVVTRTGWGAAHSAFPSTRLPRACNVAGAHRSAQEYSRRKSCRAGGSQSAPRGPWVARQWVSATEPPTGRAAPDVGHVRSPTKFTSCRWLAVRPKPVTDDGKTGFCLEQNCKRRGGSSRQAPLWVPPGFFGYRPTLGNAIAAFHIARIQLPSIGGELASIAGESRT